MRRTLSTLLVALLCLGPCWPAMAQESKPRPKLTQEQGRQLKRLIKAAKSAYNRGEFETALEKFRDAYDMYPHPDILYRIALCHERLGEDQEAVRYYRRFLAEVPDAPERPRIEKTIEVIESRIDKSALAVTTQPQGAVVYIDDEANGAAGYTPTELTLKPGNYKVIVTKDGYDPVEELVEISPGQTVELRYQLSKVGTSGNDADVAKKHHAGGPSAGVITLLSIGLTSTIGAVVMYFLWSDRKNKIDETPRQSVSRETYEGWQTQETIFLGTFIGTTSLAALSFLWAYYLARRDNAAAQAYAPPSEAPVGVGLFWDHGPGAGVMLHF